MSNMKLPNDIAANEAELKDFLESEEHQKHIEESERCCATPLLSKKNCLNCGKPRE